MKKYIFSILIALLTTLPVLAQKQAQAKTLCLIKRLPLLKKQVE